MAGGFGDMGKVKCDMRTYCVLWAITKPCKPKKIDIKKKPDHPHLKVVFFNWKSDIQLKKKTWSKSKIEFESSFLK